MDLVLKLGETGFSSALVNASLAILRQEIATRLTNSTFEGRTRLVETSSGHPSWRDFCGTAN
jgi:hypothetical protein